MPNSDASDASDVVSNPFLYTHTKLTRNRVKCVTRVTLLKN